MGLEKIEVFRKQKGIKQKELAEMAGVPLGTLTKIITGVTRDPSIDTVKAIVNAMGKTLDDLDDKPQDNTNTTIPLSISGINPQGEYFENPNENELLQILAELSNISDDALSEFKLIADFIKYRHGRD